MRYFFRVEYDGTRYGGWQRQHNALSVQEVLEKAFSTAVRAPCSVTGAGRTDAGVHAKAQGAHVDIEQELDIRRCELSVNALLPPDIAIYSLGAVSDDFHARFSAVEREYRYYLCERKRPLLYKRVWMVYYAVDWERVERETLSLVGTHDFAAFCASGSSAQSARCTVRRAALSRSGDLRVFTIAADRFVYKMVRSITGTLIDIGRGRLQESMSSIIASRDRGRVGSTAPASGLVLERVTYEGDRQ